jgi:hypothetical protein
MSAEREEGYRQRACNFAIDALTAEVASAFTGEGIGTVVLKGPVLLSADAGIRQKLVTAASDVFPRPDYMRWWSSLARRGKLGPAGAYLWRVIWIIGQAPRAIDTLWRIQRAKGRARSTAGRVR